METTTPHQFTRSHLQGSFRVHEATNGWYVIAKLNDGFRGNDWRACEGPYTTQDEAQARVLWFRKQARS